MFNSKILQRQIIEKDAQIARLMQELKMYKSLVEFSQAEAIVGIKGNEVVYKNNVAQGLVNLHHLIPQLNEKATHANCMHNEYSVTHMRIDDTMYYSILPLNTLTDSSSGTNLFEVYTKSLKTGVTETQASLQDVLTESNAVAEYSVKAAESAEDGLGMSAKALEEIEVLYEKMQVASDLVNSLTQRSNEITSVISLIYESLFALIYFFLLLTLFDIISLLLHFPFHSLLLLYCSPLLTFSVFLSFSLIYINSLSFIIKC
ncbi:hypothetical protein [uncultured Helicobacter sp.]|uniref:hypothetical protein n=1 Tax=uncultured Helicobacter sp. TaxID=175537 RepID=UPI0026115CEC|nr:hypothetical protein [uncultured Helicobacter sp.]